jgi:hypothetical protein
MKFYCELFEGGRWIRSSYTDDPSFQAGRWRAMMASSPPHRPRRVREGDECSDIVWSTQSGFVVNPYTLGLTNWLDPEATRALNSYDYPKEATPMQEQKPLHIPRTTLIERIKEAVAKRKAEHDEKRDARLKEREAKLAQVKEALGKEPLVFLNMVESCFGHLDADPVNAERASFLERLRINYPVLQADLEFTSPAEDKLISVLEAANDEEIEVFATDSFYSYL